MASPFFFFRPILSSQKAWFAFDLHLGSDTSAKSSDFLRCFASASVGSLLERLPVLISAQAEWLQERGFVERFTPGQAIFSVSPETLGNKDIVSTCHDLLNQGHHCCLQAGSSTQLRSIPLAAFDYVELDANLARQAISAVDLAYLNDAGFLRIASKIETHEMFNWLAQRGFNHYDCRFLTRHDPTRGNEPDLARFKLLKLLNLVKQDSDTREIEAVFREEPKLSYNLLRLVNSVAVGARTTITSFNQAITILGRRQLQRWLQLLIYANHLADGNAPHPLMQLAAARARQIELLSASIKPAPDIPELAENAFMVGLFSLLDILLNMPIADIFSELPLDSLVRDALVTPHQGVLGSLLNVVSASEDGDYAEAEEILKTLGISAETHAKAQVNAYLWASRINLDE